eukprot:290394-Amorphochlora_amoeboformis.AAC.1
MELTRNTGRWQALESSRTTSSGVSPVSQLLGELYCHSNMTFSFSRNSKAARNLHWTNIWTISVNPGTRAMNLLNSPDRSNCKEDRYSLAPALGVSGRIDSHWLAVVLDEKRPLHREYHIRLHLASISSESKSNMSDLSKTSTAVYYPRRIQLKRHHRKLTSCGLEIGVL